jgi:phosphoserine phosphatase
MKVVNSDKIVCFDVDDTLVSDVTEKFSESIDPSNVEIKCEGHTTTVKPIKENIDAIKRHKRQGQVVIVWSAAGYKWAESVVKSLNLQDYVDIVMSKPMWYYDDLPVQNWMGKPRWGKDRR